MLTAEDLAQLSHLLRPLRIQVASIAARATVQLVDDSGQLQTLQIGDIAGGPYDDCEHFQPYGISGVPPLGSEAIVVFPNGDRGHPLVFAAGHRSTRPSGGEPGEFTVYNGVTGAKIVFTKDGDIVATPAPGRKILAGGPSAATPPALSSELADLKARIAAWAPVPNDGGASLKTVFSAWPVPGATKVDVE